jgi:signal transduction histidine kinase
MHGHLYLLASAGNLFLAMLVIVRGRRARGALPMALLCIALFLWAVGEGMYAFSGEREKKWHYIRLIGSSMEPAFLWHFVVVFVRREKLYRIWVALLYSVTAIFTALTAGALVSAPLALYVDSKIWNLTYLGALFPFLIWSLILLSWRKREVDDPVDRNALTFVQLGIAVGTVTGLADLTHLLWAPIPRMGHVGSILCTVILAIAILEHKLLEQQSPVRQFFLVTLLGGSAAFILSVFSSTEFHFRGEAYLVLGAVVLVTALALHRLFLTHLYEQGERRKRLALIGTMAAGVAHEVKNPLAAIKGAAQFVQKELETEGPRTEAKEYLKLLVDEVDRLNGVVDSFLTYARPLEPKRQEVHLPAFLSEILRFQGPSLPAGVKITTSFDEDVPPVPADPALLRHAVTNVLANAVEAMNASGQIALRTRTIQTTLRTFAVIEIEDTGPGLAREVRERLFQPFTTTKPKGTGLGLAIALRIVEAHGGGIEVENVHPHGCRFRFHLPVRAL